MSRFPAVIVEPDMMLSDIALREWGRADLWPQLAALNMITNPNMIETGDLIITQGKIGDLKRARSRAAEREQADD